jgi:hypothetical protein
MANEREKQVLKAKILKAEARVATLEEQLDDGELLNRHATEEELRRAKQELIGLRSELNSIS